MEKSNDVNLSEVSNFITFEPMHLNVLPKKQSELLPAIEQGASGLSIICTS